MSDTHVYQGAQGLSNRFSLPWRRPEISLYSTLAADLSLSNTIVAFKSTTFRVQVITPYLTHLYIHTQKTIKSLQPTSREHTKHSQIMSEICVQFTVTVTYQATLQL